MSKLKENWDDGPAVTLALLHEDTLDYNFVHSLIQLLGYDANNHGRLWRGGIVDRRGTTGDLAAGRNGAVSDFLSSHKAEYALWIDTDMGFEPDTVERLLEAADPAERPVVGALTFAQREFEPDGMGGFRPVAWPVVMDWTVYDGRGGFEARWDYPRDVITRVHGTGSACILIHRSVFERVRDEYERIQREAGIRKEEDPPWDMWYSRVANPTTGELVGEDLSFCMRLAQVQIPIHVHTGVKTTHRKNIWLGEQDYWRQRALAPAPETVPLIPREEWVTPRYAVVPTHNRPERLKALVASLGQQCDTIVVLDNASDPATDWAELAAVAPKATVEVLRDEEQPPHLSRFWNVLFDRCAKLATDRGQEVWDVGVFNDDAVVPSGWFDACSTVLRGHESAVIAHTGTVPVHRHELVTTVDYPREKRMCPWAFVIRGEVGMRADEDLRWWYFDDQLNREAALAGGVMAVPGPLVINANAVESTTGVLAQQAELDRKTFEAKWAGQ